MSKSTAMVGASEPLSTKEKILDAAEELFAERGYYGVSIRQITSKAGVELALVNYHFGKKENLFRQVINRRAEEHCDGFWRALAEVRSLAADGPPSVEAIIRAFCAPIFEKTMRGGPGWKNYIQLLSYTADSKQSHSFLKPFIEHYDPVVEAFVEAFREALPGASDRAIYYSVYFLQAELVYSLAETGGIDRLSRGLVDGSDFDALLQEIVPFFAAGFEALAGDGRQAD